MGKRGRSPALAADAVLRGQHFAVRDGTQFVERTSLAKKITGKQGDKILKATWRRLGYDAAAPPIDGVAELPFAAQRGHARNKPMPAANLQGLHVFVGELDPDCVDANKGVLTQVSVELGGPVELKSRHWCIQLCAGKSVALALGVTPSMVLATLVEAFGYANASRYINGALLPYFAACGVLGVDIPDNALANRRPVADQYTEAPEEDCRYLSRCLPNGSQVDK